MTDKLFKFYVVFGIFGIWMTVEHNNIIQLCCSFMLVIICILSLKGEHNDR